ncbi:hypothetical protein ACFQ14_08445 [Pseudahrensia aquimaris]|uniref:Uncharacterized protein n=1 Tax=Pseudahrensia aquimaris TaxID=744461 RepID=A0ABW3FFE3_9HYPH
MSAHRLPTGVTLYALFVDVYREKELLGFIDAAVWEITLKRRVQLCGWRYDYHARPVTPYTDREPLADMASVKSRMGERCN